VLRRFSRHLSERSFHVTHNWLCVAKLCRRASQLDSSYESHVASAASFQTSAMGVAFHSDRRSVGILFSGDSSVNLFVSDSSRPSGGRFCQLHQGLECNHYLCARLLT